MKRNFQEASRFNLWMIFVAVLLMFAATLISGCTESQMQACRQMCPMGVKHFDGQSKGSACICNSVEDVCNGRTQ